MKKNHVYITLIILLIILNIAQLGTQFVFPKPPPHVAAQNLKLEIPKMLDLDENQKQVFFELATNHREQIILLQKQQRELTTSYINNPSDSLLNQITDFHKQKIILTENHFNDVYNLLNEAQKVNFLKFKQAAFQVINR